METLWLGCVEYRRALDLQLSRVDRRARGETPDTLLVTYEFQGFLGSWEHRNNNSAEFRDRMMGLSFHGDKGTLYVDRSHYRLVPEKGSSLEASEMKRVTDPHPLHWVNFLECVRTREKPNSDIEKCFRSSVTSALANAAYLSKLRLDWDEQKMVPVQKEARRYLFREYRKPWKLEV